MARILLYRESQPRRRFIETPLRDEGTAGVN
jgi:hypothetical protein